MKKKGTRLLALLLAAMMVLTACGGGGEPKQPDTTDTPPATTDGETPSTTPETPTTPVTDNKGEPIKDFVTYQTATAEMETLFTLYSESAGDLDYLTNCIAGLLEIDNRGKFIPGIAKEWDTPDEGKTWTFKLRDDVVWVDVNGNEMAKCTSKDWLTSLEYVLNWHKNSGRNSSMPRMMIAGAEEYFKTVEAMDEAEALELNCDSDLFKNTVGIEAPDDYTLVYHCVSNMLYFDSLAVSAALMPLSQGQLDAVGVGSEMNSIENTDLWYNGPYIMTEYIQNNSKTFTRNESYYDKDCTLFDTVTVLMVDDVLMGQQLFMNGEVDIAPLSESNLRTIYGDPNNEWYEHLVEGRPSKYSYQAHFNFHKKLDDGSEDDNWNNAIANTAFRQSIYYGMDLTNYWARTNFIHPEKCENVAYTMKGLLYFSDGTDYVEHVWEKIGLPDGRGRYDATKAQQLVEQAKQELEGKVTFPVQLDHWIAASNQNSLDQAVVLKEIIEAIGGPEYITLNIRTYATSLQKEVTDFRLHCWSFGNGWGADYADPENFLFQELYDDAGALYSMNTSFINEATDPQLIEDYKTYTAMVREAAGIYDKDERYEKFAEAEAFMLDKAFVVPVLYQVNWRLTKVNAYTQKYAMFGMQNNMWKNWETSTEPYTTEQYTQLEAAFNAGN